MLVGERATLGVEAFTTDGFFVRATSVSFESSDPLVASVSSSGQLRGLRAGSVLLTVRANGISVTQPVHVRATRCTAPLLTRTTTTDATLEGSIGLASCVLGDAAAEAWRLTLAVPTTIVLERTLGADYLDLLVTDDAFQSVPEAYSVFGTGGDRGRLARTLAPGSYHLFVRSELFDSTAAFRVRVTPRVACTELTATEPAAPGIDLTRAFGPADCVLPSGSTAQQWVLQPAERTLYSVQTLGRGARVGSGITGPDGLLLWATQTVVQGDSGMIDTYEVPPGRHVLWVRTSAPDSVQTTYSLSLRAPAVCAPDQALPALALGDTLRGSLTLDGCRARQDHLGLAQPYAVQVVSPGTIEIDLVMSAVTGLWIALRNSAGQTVAVTTQFVSPGTVRHTAAVTPGAWQVLVSGYGYLPDPHYALVLRTLP